MSGKSRKAPVNTLLASTDLNASSKWRAARDNITLAFLATLLCGCGTWFVPSYGYIADDDPPLVSTYMTIPETAPSILQGFAPVIEVEHSAYGLGHEGIDIAANRGTPVIAAAAGTVVVSKWEPMYGHQIVIQHDAKAQDLFVITRYFHLNERLKKTGDRVMRGQSIGTLGSTGLLAGYPHLHFEVRMSNTKDSFWYTATNPHKYWADGAGRVSCFYPDKTYEEAVFEISYPVPCK